MRIFPVVVVWEL